MLVPAEFGGLGLSAGRGLPGAAPARLPRARHGAGDQHAPVLDRHRAPTCTESATRRSTWMLRGGGGGRGLRGRATARPATTCPVLLSTAQAERVDGGYRFTGHKMFGSLTPVWTRLGIHAHGHIATRRTRRSSTPSCRATPTATRSRRPGTRSGMRATRSDDTILDGAFVPDQYIARKLPAGGCDPFVLALFAWAPHDFGNIYYGIAPPRRAIWPSRPRARRPRWPSRRDRWPTTPRSSTLAAEMTLELEAMGAAPRPDRRRTGRTGVDHGAAWPSKLVGAEVPRRRVRQARGRPGDGRSPAGPACSRRNELERLYRDVRCGGFHPPTRRWSHEIVGKTALGIASASSRAGADHTAPT